MVHTERCPPKDEITLRTEQDRDPAHAAAVHHQRTHNMIVGIGGRKKQFVNGWSCGVPLLAARTRIVDDGRHPSRARGGGAAFPAQRETSVGWSSQRRSGFVDADARARPAHHDALLDGTRGALVVLSIRRDRAMPSTGKHAYPLVWKRTVKRNAGQINLVDDSLGLRHDLPHLVHPPHRPLVRPIPVVLRLPGQNHHKILLPPSRLTVLS
ncbi:hypothetical protein OF83DRAFT_870071 [Amylostereum chailletii]|nr:hypothetical protein OF83DRAFT_870071 [Amylostereum chailletii]